MFYMNEHIERSNDLHRVGTHSHPLPIVNIGGERGGPTSPHRGLDSALDPHTLSLPSTALHLHPQQYQGFLSPAPPRSPPHLLSIQAIRVSIHLLIHAEACPHAHSFPRPGINLACNYTLNKHVLGKSMNRHTMTTKRGLFRGRLVHSPVQQTEIYLNPHTPGWSVS